VGVRRHVRGILSFSLWRVIVFLHSDEIERQYTSHMPSDSHLEWSASPQKRIRRDIVHNLSKYYAALQDVESLNSKYKLNQRSVNIKTTNKPIITPHGKLTCRRPWDHFMYDIKVFEESNKINNRLGDLKQLMKNELDNIQPNVFDPNDVY